MHVPIKVTTEYTLLSSLIKLDDLFKYLTESNIKACGICDSNLFGAYLFYKKCKENNIKPIIGLDVKVSDYHVYLYAKNLSGYKKLLNIDYIKQEKELSIIDLVKYDEDLIFVLPYESRVLAKELKSKDLYLSYKNNDEKKNIFVNNYKGIFLEDIKVIKKEDGNYLNYLSLIKSGKKEEEIEKIKYPSLEEYFNSEIIDEEISNFIEKINIEFPEKPNYLPKYSEEKDTYNLLISLCKKGLNKRLHNEVSKEYENRLIHELEIISKMGFVDYFLIVYDYVLYAKKHDIAVGPGRGSAAGSLVSYSLGITDIDPLKYDLLFERFLNPMRVTMPDIDIDFEDEKRYEVINYVKEKYGKDKVGLIITYGTMQAKQALRDVARCLNIEDNELSSLMKYIDADKDLIENYTTDVKNILNSNERLKKCYKIASKIFGLKRHTSIHAAGVVISSKSLKDIVPVLCENNEIIIGLTMNELEENGLLKMDFLALKNLSTIKEIVNEINKDNHLDINNIPLNDKKTYELFKNGDTKGIFQFETKGMQNILPKLSPESFSDLVAAVALFRPGPMDNIDLYIRNKKNPDRIRYPHENLRSILKETYGIIVYQEQIMQILKVMADYNMAEADNVRRAMSKKKEEVLIKEKDNFINRAINKGYTKEIAENVYSLILKFANYGFNKAHSVSYALIGYKMAYLKANYPDKFILCNLNIFGRAQIKCKEYLNEALKYHLKLHKPLINKSTNNFILNGVNILLPFNQIVGISEDFALEISKERSNGEYKSIFDFVRRIKKEYVTENNLKKLINADVFRKFGYNQKSLISNIDSIINYANLTNGISEDMNIEEPFIIVDREYDEKELRFIEKETFGFYVSNHPSSSYQNKVVKIENIKNYFDKSVNMIVLIEKISTFKTKKNDTMASLMASDETGEMEFIIFPKNINLVDNLSEGDIILVSGTVGRRFNDYQIIVNKINKKNK